MCAKSIAMFFWVIVFTQVINTVRSQYGDQSLDTSKSISCDRYLVQPEQWLLSPLYPNDYGSNRLCTFTVNRVFQDVCKVQLLLTNFRLPRNNRCKEDYLELSDGQRLCGHLPINSIRELIDTFNR